MSIRTVDFRRKKPVKTNVSMKAPQIYRLSWVKPKQRLRVKKIYYKSGVIW